MFGRRRRARLDAGCAARVDAWRAEAANSGLSVIRILRVTDYRGRGTKADVQLEGQPWVRDCFFWWVKWVQAGQLISVDASQGWGPHTRKGDVLWIGSQYSPSGTGIGAMISAEDARRWRRHHNI